MVGATERGEHSDLPYLGCDALPSVEGSATARRGLQVKSLPK
jgi:hypothetical protein